MANNDLWLLAENSSCLMQTLKISDYVTYFLLLPHPKGIKTECW